MTIPRKRLEELACQFLMMVEILCKENEMDVYDNLAQLSTVTEEELLELNFPLKYYLKERRKHMQEKDKSEQQSV